MPFIIFGLGITEGTTLNRIRNTSRPKEASSSCKRVIYIMNVIPETRVPH